VFARIGEVFKEFFKGWNSFELIFLQACIVFPVVLGILFGSGALEIVSAVMLLISTLLLAKGKVKGFMLYIISLALYCVVSFQQQLYGELIYSALLSIPLASYGLWKAWSNKRNDSDKGEVIIVQRIKMREIGLLLLVVIAVSIGMYFLLDFFNTAFLIVSTISLASNLLGEYLVARRTQFGMSGFILSDIIGLILWALLLADGHMGAIPLIVAYCFLFVNDIYGTIEWQRLRKEQVVEMAMSKVSKETVWELETDKSGVKGINREE